MAPDAGRATAARLDRDTVPDRNSPHLVLWNTEAFYALRPELAPQYTRLDHHDDNGRLVGSVIGARDGASFVAGASAPFGGPDLTRDYEPVASVVTMLRTTLAELERSGVRDLQFRMKPPHHSASEPGVHFALLNMGFAVTAADLNFSIDLSPFGSVDEYVRSLKPPARRAIRYAEDLALEPELLDRLDDDAWFECYEVLRENRESKGRPMRLPFDYVRRLRDAFPGLARMVALRHQGRVCAAALVYRIGRGSDLVQYWGDAAHSLPHSPMNLLVREVVGHSLATGAAMLDLGISTDDGVANSGLVQFKRSVGATSELRVVLARSVPG